jgi:hypothetical protein
LFLKGKTTYAGEQSPRPKRDREGGQDGTSRCSNSRLEVEVVGRAYIPNEAVNTDNTEAIERDLDGPYVVNSEMRPPLGRGNSTEPPD